MRLELSFIIIDKLIYVKYIYLSHICDKCDLCVCGMNMNVYICMWYISRPTIIHSKSGISWMDKSADDLEFSAEGLSRNAKNIKFTLLEEPALQFVTIYV